MDVSKTMKSILKTGSLTHAEAAKMLDVHPLTVTRWASGTLGAHKLSAEKLKQLDAHIKAQK